MLAPLVDGDARERGRPGADGLRRLAAAARSGRRGGADPAPRVHRGHVGPAASLSLARAYIRQGEFAAALPLLEWQLAGDTDGSVHVQLSRALTGIGDKDKADAMLAKSQEIQRRGAGAGGGGGEAGDQAAEMTDTRLRLGSWELEVDSLLTCSLISTR